MSINNSSVAIWRSGQSYIKERVSGGGPEYFRSRSVPSYLLSVLLLDNYLHCGHFTM